MHVKFKGLKGAVIYRSKAFVNQQPTEVTEEWLEKCTNPRIVKTKPKPKPKTKPKTKADNVTS